MFKGNLKFSVLSTLCNMYPLSQTKALSLSLSLSLFHAPCRVCLHLPRWGGLHCPHTSLTELGSSSLSALFIVLCCTYNRPFPTTMLWGGKVGTKWRKYMKTCMFIHFHVCFHAFMNTVSPKCRGARGIATRLSRSSG